jgi:phage host-nuclease inhibitor protein Gam
VDDLLDELEDFMADVEADAEAGGVDIPVEPPADADRANAMLRLVRRLEREAKEIEVLAGREAERIRAWRDDRLSGIDRRVGSLTDAVEQWARAVNRYDPTRKTLHLPNGVLKLRAGATRCVIVDPEEFMAWEREQNVMAVARYLRDAGRALVVDSAESRYLEAPASYTVEMAETIMRLVEEQRPLVTVKIEPSKTAIKRDAVPGPELHRTDGEVEHPAVVDGEVVPGVSFVTETRARFSLTTT